MTLEYKNGSLKNDHTKTYKKKSKTEMKKRHVSLVSQR